MILVTVFALDMGIWLHLTSGNAKRIVQQLGPLGVVKLVVL